MANNTITVTAVLNNLISPQLRQIQSQLSTLNTTQTRAFSGMSSTLSTLKSGLTAVLGVVTGVVAGVGLIGKSIVETTAEMEKYNAVLTNTFGSANKAATAMSMITEFAAKTPFQINTLTDSYVKLVNQGFIPTEEQMTKLGDLASSTGKEFSQLAEAILDAQTGEFERLKEFGIKASKEGDNVSFAFKGVTTTVKGTSEEIQKYILSLGDLEGVTGSMAAISNTLAGRISNLKDKIQQFAVSIGDAFSIELKNSIEKISTLLDNVKPIIISILTQLKDFKLDINVDAGQVLVDILTSINENMFRFMDILKIVISAISDMTSSISSSSEATFNLEKIFKLLTLTTKLSLAPMMLVVKTTTFISDAIKSVKDKLEELGVVGQIIKGILYAIFSPLLLIFGPIILALKAINYLLDNMTSVANKAATSISTIATNVNNLTTNYDRLFTSIDDMNDKYTKSIELMDELTLKIFQVSQAAMLLNAENTKDPFKFAETIKENLKLYGTYLELTSKQTALTASIEKNAIADPSINVTGGSTATTLKGSDVNLSTDRSVTNYTIEVAKIVETGGIVFNTENITESSIELEKAMTNVFIKMMGDISNIKMK